MFATLNGSISNNRAPSCDVYSFSHNRAFIGLCAILILKAGICEIKSFMLLLFAYNLLEWKINSMCCWICIRTYLTSTLIVFFVAATKKLKKNKTVACYVNSLRWQIATMCAAIIYIIVDFKPRYRVFCSYYFQLCVFIRHSILHFHLIFQTQQVIALWRFFQTCPPGNY